MLAAASAVTGIDWVASLVTPVLAELLLAVKAAAVLFVAILVFRLGMKIIGEFTLYDNDRRGGDW